MSFVLLLVVCYLVGAIPSGVLLTRLTGAGDVRRAGSGNIGATNVYRVAGRLLGLCTLAGDVFKGLLPVLLVMKSGAWLPWQVAVVAAVTFLGHLYPIYLGFKGGKGVATALGIFLVLSPLAVLVAFIAFALVLWRWRYVSLASITGAALIPLLIAVFAPALPLFGATLFISTMVVVRHRSNIQRLIAGTENRFKA